MNQRYNIKYQKFNTFDTQCDETRMKSLQQMQTDQEGNKGETQIQKWLA